MFVFKQVLYSSVMNALKTLPEATALRPKIRVASPSDSWEYTAQGRAWYFNWPLKCGQYFI